MFDILRDYWPMLLVGQYPHGPLGGLAMTLIVAGLGLLLDRKSTRLNSSH